MTISLSGDTANRLNGGMQTGNSIELPYFTPKFWVVNGDPRLRAVGGAQFFGGFAVTVEDWQKACEELGIEVCTPPGFIQTETETQDGKTLEVFMSRNLIVAPIANRVTWTNADGQRFNAYAPGTRQHAQVIAYMARKLEDGTFDTFGPIMITAKGFQAKNVLDSFGAWDRATKQVRGKVAPGVPAWCFYLSVGTFGERKQVLVGKGAQSPITPITAYIPKEINGELLERLFVGQEVAETMLVYLEDAEEWLHAYEQKQGMVAAGVQLGGHMTALDSEFPDPIPPFGDDVPF